MGPAAVETRVRDYLALFRNDAWGTITLGQILADSGRFSEAEAVLRKARSMWRPVESQFGLYREYAALAERQQNWDEAVVRWGMVTKRFPSRPESFFAEARALHKVGNSSAAREQAAKSLALLPNYEPSLRLLADIAEFDADWPRAVARWEAYRKHFDTQPEGYLRGANALAQSGKSRQAVQLLDSVVVIFPSNEKAQSERARILAELS